MRKMKQLWLLGLLALALGGSAVGAQTTVYVHGFKMWVADHRFGSCNDQTTCSGYWKNQIAGDVRHVGWNGAQPWITSGVDAMTAVFNNRCRRDKGQSCKVICHSTGCPITAYVLDKRNPYVANKGYTFNITHVQALGSAEGGSDLADDGTTLKALTILPAGDALSSGIQLLQVAFTGPGRDYLKPSYLRNKYTMNHDNTAGVPFRMVAGNNKGWNWLAGVLKSVLSLDILKIVDPLIGNDDGVVAFHSACAYSERFYSYNCSSDWKACCRGFACYKGVTCEVRQWSNHARSQDCGRGACNKNHSELADEVRYHTIN